MDTRFWGPSGWRLLHLIAAEKLTGSRAVRVKDWFELLEYVLPCKHCRASFHDYMKLQPLTVAIVRDRDAFSRWLYDIHNRVNGKLRGQGLLTTADPAWPTVKQEYYALHSTICKGSPLLGWDFMTSVAFTTPAADYTPTPMSDAPEEISDWLTMDLATKNRYNLLTRDERIGVLKRWWRLIPTILPCESWRQVWKTALRTAAGPPLIHGREAVMHWMWRVEESVCAGLKCPTPHPSLPALQNDLAAFESPCSGVRGGRTCRTRKHRQRRLVMTRRRRALT